MRHNSVVSIKGGVVEWIQYRKLCSSDNMTQKLLLKSSSSNRSEMSHLSQRKSGRKSERKGGSNSLRCSCRLSKKQ